MMFSSGVVVSFIPGMWVGCSAPRFSGTIFVNIKFSMIVMTLVVIDKICEHRSSRSFRLLNNVFADMNISVNLVTNRSALVRTWFWSLCLLATLDVVRFAVQSRQFGSSGSMYGSKNDMSLVSSVIGRVSSTELLVVVLN